MVDRGHFADPDKRALLSAAKKVTHLTPAIGTEIEGLDLRQLSDVQKDELYVASLYLFETQTFINYDCSVHC